MVEEKGTGTKARKDEFPGRIHAREQRKLRAREKGVRDVWFGLGTFGVVGWSVAVPTLAGIFLGIWIDSSWPSERSWTLMLLLVGLVGGLLNAWFWVERQRKRISKEHEE